MHPKPFSFMRLEIQQYLATEQDAGWMEMEIPSGDIINCLDGLMDVWIDGGMAGWLGWWFDGRRDCGVYGRLARWMALGKC